MRAAHDSFSIRPMSAEQAESQLDAGHIVAIIKIPKGFEASISHGQTVPVQVDIDNVDADMTDDIERRRAVGHRAVWGPFRLLWHQGQIRGARRDSPMTLVMFNTSS